MLKYSKKTVCRALCKKANYVFLFFFLFQAEIKKTNDEVYELKKDINECLTGPCQNYLQCIDLDDGFECKCQPGAKY